MVCSKKRRTYIIFFVLLFGCDTFGPDKENNESKWVNLGLNHMDAEDIQIYEGNIFVSAGDSGLYKLEKGNIENEWRYLGFAKDDASDFNLFGVVDFKVWKEKVLVSAHQKRGSEAAAAYSGIWISNDQGDTWNPLDNGLRDNNGDEFFQDGQLQFVDSIYVDEITLIPNEEDLIFASNKRVDLPSTSIPSQLYVKMGENAFITIQIPDGLTSIRKLLFDEITNSLYVLGEGGVFRLENPELVQSQ
ncbi:MAG: hypothetical protein JJ971_04780 [Balneolaceae bacterium]|nr:hypothetical protein [Balneolaceae bacterium]MBO6545691.1 hypothetical protein [Balneolaceae bacterium]MBO6647087.1 hypothetical protein [Balneolaceae bacterium]